MIHVLYLAAGQARRYGSNKLLATYRGKPLYRHGLDTILALTDGRTDVTVTVVTCWCEIEEALLREWNLEKKAKVHKEVGEMPENLQPSIGTLHDTAEYWTDASGTRRLVHCPDSHLGISHSIRDGIASLPEVHAGEYLCFVVADQPELTLRSMAALLKNADGETVTACLCADGCCGNPVLFHSSLIPELLALQGDRGGKSVMRSHPERHVDVPCDSVELRDIDVPDSIK